MRSIVRLTCLFALLAAPFAAAQEVVTIFGTTTDEGEILIYRLGNEVDRITLDGQVLPADRYVHSDEHITVLTPEGKQLARVIGSPMGGRLNVFREAPRMAIPPYMGVFLDSVDAAVATYLDLDAEKVCLVREVVDGGPAEKAGFRAHDIILSLEGSESAGEDDVRQVVRSSKVGDTLRFEVRSRDGAARTIALELGARPGGATSSPEVPILQDIPLLGQMFSGGGRQVKRTPPMPTRVLPGPSGIDAMVEPKSGGGKVKDGTSYLIYDKEGASKGERVWIGARPGSPAGPMTGAWTTSTGEGPRAGTWVATPHDNRITSAPATSEIVRKLDEIAKRLDELEKLIGELK